MKKYFVFAAAALVALASCSKVEPDPASENGPELTFQAARYTASTKADEGADVDGSHRVFYSTGHFGVYSYFSPADWTKLSEASLYMGTESAGAEIYKGAKTTDVYSAEDAYYWPKAGSLTFIGYYPYGTSNVSAVAVNTTEIGLTISGYSVKAAVADQTASSQVTITNNKITNDLNDLMVAAPTYSARENSAATHYAEGVPMLFKHILSKVKFQAKVADLKAELPLSAVVTNVEIQKIANTGTYTTPASSSATTGWVPTSALTTTSGAIATATAKTAGSTIADGDVLTSTPTAIGSDYYVLPQTLGDDALISVSYTVYSYDKTSKAVKEAKSYTSTVAVKALSTSWDDNHVYTYTLIIDCFSGEITFDPGVTPWTEEDATDASVE